MGVNISYEQSTFVVPTGTPRQWRVRFAVEKNGVTKNYDQIFPDDLQSLVSQGVLTNQELKEWLFMLVELAIRKKEEVE